MEVAVVLGLKDVKTKAIAILLLNQHLVLYRQRVALVR